jgi:copper transport protein
MTARLTAGRLTLARLLVAGAVLAVTLLAVAGPADAHAVLESTDPPAGAVVVVAPTTVRVTFNEPVGAQQGDLRVYDSTGRRVDRGSLHHLDSGRALQVDLQALRPGGYAVTWRVISADTHPVSGAVTWRFGESGGAAVGDTLLNNLLGAAHGSTAVSAALAVQRALVFGSLIVLLGGVAFVLFLWPEGAVDRWWRLVMLGSVGVGIVASIAGIFLQAANVAGLGFGSILDGAPIGEVVRGDYGQAAIGRALGLALIGFLVTRLTPGPAPDEPSATEGEPVPERELVPAGGPTPPGGLASGAEPSPQAAPGSGGAVATRAAPGWVRPSLVVLGVLVAGSLGFAGHPRTGRWLPIALPFDIVHVLAASVWIGGLVVLVAIATPKLDPPATRALVLRFSPVAFTCVAVLVATGTAQAFRQLDGGWTALRSSDYGHLLIIKVVVTAVVVAVGGSSRSLVRSGWIDDTEEDAAWSRHLVRRAIASEVVLAAVVIGVTSLLVASNPNAATAATAYSASRVDGPVIVDAVVAPARPGPVSVHLYVSDPNAALTQPFDTTAQLELPGKVAPVDLPLLPAGGRHWIADGVEAPIAGLWRLTVRVVVGGLDEHVFVFNVPIH